MAMLSARRSVPSPRGSRRPGSPFPLLLWRRLAPTGAGLTAAILALACQGSVTGTPDPGDKVENDPDLQVQVAPDSVIELRVTATTPSSVTLSFREADDGQGRPASYDIRFARAPLGDRWGSATSVSAGSCSVPVRGEAVGRSRGCTVEGLEPGTAYDFQLVPFRGNMNQGAVYGPLSEIVRGSTDSAPEPPEESPADPPSGPPGGASGSNQPPGFTRIAEHDFSCRPGAGCALAGEWREHPDSWQRSNLTLAKRSDAPVSGPNVIRTRFPRNLRAGVGPASFSGWSTLQGSREYRALYFSMWLRVVGPDFENHPTLTKLGWFGFGSGTVGNEGSLQLYTQPYTGRVEAVTSMQPRFVQQNHVARAVWGWPKTEVGRWVHWEILLELNEVGRSNGVLRWWQDGRLVASADDMVYVTPEARRGFHSFHWNPTWGGTGEFAKSRDDHIEIDHIYISGRP